VPPGSSVKNQAEEIEQMVVHLSRVVRGIGRQMWKGDWP
jgi:hypothetical protein